MNFLKSEWTCKKGHINDPEYDEFSPYRCSEHGCNEIRFGVKIAGIVAGAVVFLIILGIVLYFKACRGEFEADIRLQKQEAQEVQVDKDKEFTLLPQEGYKVKVKAEKGECNFYAFQISVKDEKDKSLPKRLFPNDNFIPIGNPLRLGKEVVIPENKEEWLRLSKEGKVYYLYLIAGSEQRINELYEDAKNIKPDTPREERDKKRLLEDFYERLSLLKERPNLIFRRLVLNAQEIVPIIVSDTKGFEVKKNKLVPDLEVGQKVALSAKGKYNAEWKTIEANWSVNNEDKGKGQILEFSEKNQGVYTVKAKVGRSSTSVEIHVVSALEEFRIRPISMEGFEIEGNRLIPGVITDEELDLIAEGRYQDDWRRIDATINGINIESSQSFSFRRNQPGTYRVDAQAKEQRDWLFIPVMKIEPEKVTLRVGEKISFKVFPSQEAYAWKVVGNIGYINDKGEFVAESIGEGEVIANVDVLTLKATVIIVRPNLIIGGDISTVVAKSDSVPVIVGLPGSEYSFEIVGEGERGKSKNGELIWGYFDGKLMLTFPKKTRETITLKFCPNSSPYEELEKSITISEEKEKIHRNFRFPEKGEK